MKAAQLAQRKDSDKRKVGIREVPKKGDCRSSNDQGRQTWRMLNIAATCATRVSDVPISCRKYATLASPTGKAKGESHGLHGQIPLDQSEPCLHMNHHGHPKPKDLISYEKGWSTQAISLCSYTCLELPVLLEHPSLLR